MLAKSVPELKRVSRAMARGAGTDINFLKNSFKY